MQGQVQIILTKWIKLQLEKKLVSSFKNMQNIGFEQTLTKFIGIFHSVRITSL